MLHSTLTHWRATSQFSQSFMLLWPLYLCLQHLPPVRRANLTVTGRGLQLQVVLILIFCVMFFCHLLEEVFIHSKERLSLGRVRAGHASKELWFHAKESSVVHTVTTTAEYALKTVWGSSVSHVFDFKAWFLERFYYIHPFPDGVWLLHFKPVKWARRWNLRISRPDACRSLSRCFLNHILCFN